MAEIIQFNIQAFGSQQVVNEINTIFAAIAKTTAKQKELNDQLAILRNRTKAGASAKANLANELVGDPNDIRGALTKVKKELKDYDKQASALAAKMSNINIVPSAGPLVRHRQEIKRLTDAYLALSAAERKGAAGSNILNQIRSQSASVNQALADVKKATGQIEKTINTPAKGNSSISNFLGTFANVAKFQIANKVIDLVVQSINHAIDVTIQFDKELTNLGALLNSQDAPKLKDLADQALFLGQTTAFTATEVVKLQTELVKLGFKPEEILVSTKAIIDFSVAVRESADRVAKLTGSTLKSFNLTSIETVRVVDALTRATIDSALNFVYLETALPTVASAAAAAGLSLEEVLGVMEVLADRGVPASTAATAFRNILIESAKSGYTYQEALEEITNSQNKLATAFDLFGKRGAVQAIILAKNLDEVNKKTRQLETGIVNLSNGIESNMASAAEIASKQLESLDGRLTLLSSAWDGFILTITGTDWAKDVVSQTTASINGISALINGTVSLRDAFTQIGKGTTVGNNPFKFLENAGYIAAERAAIEQGVLTLLQKQASTESAIFDLKRSGAERLRIEQDLIKSTTALYVKAGLSQTEAAQKSAKSITNQITLLKKLKEQQEKLKADEELNLLQFGAKDIAAVETIDSAKQLVEAFNEQLERTRQIQDKVKFEKFLKLADAANKKLKELQANAGLGKDADRGVKNVETLTKRLGELFKQFQEAPNDEVRSNLLGEISSIQRSLDEAEAGFNSFLSRIQVAALRASSPAIKKLALDAYKEKLDLEQIFIEQKAQRTEQSETALAKRLEQIRNAFAIRAKEFELNQFESTTDDFKRLRGELQKLSDDSIKITVELKRINFDDTSDRELAQELEEISRKNIGNKERENLISRADLKNQQKKLEYERSILLVKQGINGILVSQGILSKALTEEELKRLSELNVLFTELQLKGLDTGLRKSLGLDAKELDENLKTLKEINKVYQDLNDGTIQKQIDDPTDKTGKPNLLTGETDKNALEVANFRIKEIIANNDIAIAQLQYQLAQATSVAEQLTGNGLSKSTEEKELEALKSLNEKKAALGALYAEKDVENERFKVRLQRKVREEGYKQLLKLSETFGAKIGEALVGADATKLDFKELMKDLIDIYTQLIIGQLTLELFKDTSTLNFVKAATTALAIAGVSAVGAVAKGVIDKFEYGGRIQTADKSGGKVRGNSHTQGGVQYRVKNSHYFPELEGGEIIINKRSAAIYKDELSRINSYKGYGKKFGDGGVINRTPQVLNPNTTTQSITLDGASMLQQAELIADRVSSSQINVLLQQNTALVEALSVALNDINRLKERVDIAKIESRV